jgi:arylsulfatase A-like enzyme
LINLYDDEVVYIDIFLKEFIDGLKSIRSFDFDNTMFIITSDHGEHIGEKGHFGHALSLYDELLWVPLLIKFPGNSYAKGPDRRLCTLNDLFATVLEVCECPIPVPRSAVSLIAQSQRDSLASMIIDSKFMWKEIPESQTGPEWRKKVRSSKFALYLSDGWKIIRSEDNSIEIYNLTSSLSEDSNLLSSLPEEIVSHFNGLIDYYQNEVGYNDIITDNRANPFSD